MKSPDQRLVDLEIRYTEQEDLLAKLDAAVREQETRIQKLEAGLRHYAARVRSLGGEVVERDLADDRPPHY